LATRKKTDPSTQQCPPITLIILWKAVQIFPKEHTEWLI
jgi:hypothetical protein